MTKQIKTIFSFLLIITMFFSCVPGVLAIENDNTPDTTLFGAVSIGSENDESILTDGVYFRNYESSGLNVTQTPNPEENLDKLAKFTAVDSGIEYSWDSSVTMKRLDLWILNECGGVGTYNIETSEDGSVWTPVMENRNLDLYDGTSKTKSFAVYHPIVFDNPITAKKIRFVIKSFADSSNVAYISEAKISDTNEINISAHPLYPGNSGKFKASSPYLSCYNMSTKDTWDNRNAHSSTYWGFVWHYNSSGSPINLSAYTTSADENAKKELWYSTGLNGSKAKINKITLDINAGSIQEFEVWAAPKNDNYNINYNNTTDKKPIAKYPERWTKVATIGCDISASSTESERTFEIPEAILADGFYFEATQFTEGTTLTAVDMYCVADNELSSIAKATEKAIDEITLNDSYSKLIVPETVEYDAEEYDVEWLLTEGSIENLIDADGNIIYHKDEEEVTITIKVNKKSTSVPSYSVDKKITLPPRANEFSISASQGVLFEAGTDATLLTDGFFFSYYDKEKDDALSPSENHEKFAKVTREGDYIDFDYFAPDTMKRLDLWVYPAGAIKEYEILFSDSNTDYSGAEKVEGSLDENVLATSSVSESHAVYYPLLFEEKTAQYVRFVIKSFNEGFNEAYISEARLGKLNNTDFAGVCEGATGESIGLSHYMQSYCVSNTSDTDPSYRKGSSAVWPMYTDGTSPSVTGDGSVIWYATAFSTLPVKLSRITVPLLQGTANEVELLCAEGEDSGFDMSSDYPACPDTNASWKSVAIVRGSFSAGNKAVIDLKNAPLSKYWMVKVKGVSTGTALGRVGFSLIEDSVLSPLAEITEMLFDSVTTDLSEDAAAKTKINIFPKYTYKGNDYPVIWESTSPLVNKETGEISEHEAESKTVMTAIISDPDNASASYCVSKEFSLEGMMKVKLFEGQVKTPDSGILTDNFTYSPYDRIILMGEQNACYNLSKFIKFDSVNSGFEFYWDNPRVIKRLHLWIWPVAAIRDYEIQVSNDGEIWETHQAGTLPDQYENDAASRPLDTSDAAGTSCFYPIVFDRPTQSVKYIRFVIKSLRNPEQGAYIAEAYFHETNDINLVGMGSIPGLEEHKSYKKWSQYAIGYYLSDSVSTDASYNRESRYIWPGYSNGTLLGIQKTDSNPCWYATSFLGAPVKINKAYINVTQGEVLEYEVMCATTNNSGFVWQDYPPLPEDGAPWRTVARVSGKFTAGISECHFDNDIESQYWMIKITEATDDLVIGGVGMYSLAESELNASSFILDKVFDNVSDTALDNVIKEKMNIPAQLSINANTYDVKWSYDTEKINPDGTVIPSLTDSETVLTAHIGKAEEGYKHIVKKTFYLMSQNTNQRTAICEDENISLENGAGQSYNAALENRFVFEGKKEVEIDFGESHTGKLSIMSGDTKLLELSVKPDKIVINEGTQTEQALDFAEKIKLDIQKGTFNMYLYKDGAYKVELYNSALLSDALFDCALLKASDDGVLAIDTLSVKVVSDELFKEVKNQFDFAKISPQYRATNLNADLNLITKTGDVNFSYVSGEGINLTDTPGVGKVDLTLPRETYITVTGVSASTGQSFTKTFNVLTARENMLSASKSKSPATAVVGKEDIYAADGNLESEFVTNAGNYRVNIDLQEKKKFNKIRIFEADTEKKILGFTISVSDNNVDFTKVYEGTQINSADAFTIPYSDARFIKIEVTATSGAPTGIKDVCAYNEMSDTEKLAYDYKSVENIEVKNGTTVIKLGELGTSFSLTSDNSAVEISETEDKTAYKVTVKAVSSETVANITLTATNGSATPIVKSWQITVLASSDIRDNTFSDGGGSGGSGGGGGNVSKPSSSVAITPSVSPGTYADNELTDHWGSNEIKTLILKGIVEGDGNSLNLTKSVTRAEFCKMIVSALGYDTEAHQGTFYDVSQHDWYAGYAETAYKYGIMSGDDRGFRGNDVISRQEMAVVLVNALKSKGLQMSSEAYADFTDGGSIAPWAQSYVQTASQLDLLRGYDTGEFKPEKNLQRDEAMVVVYRVLSYLDK